MISKSRSQHPPGSFVDIGSQPSAADGFKKEQHDWPVIGEERPVRKNAVVKKMQSVTTPTQMLPAPICAPSSATTVDDIPSGLSRHIVEGGVVVGGTFYELQGNDARLNFFCSKRGGTTYLQAVPRHMTEGGMVEGGTFYSWEVWDAAVSRPWHQAHPSAPKAAASNFVWSSINL